MGGKACIRGMHVNEKTSCRPYVMCHGMLKGGRCETKNNHIGPVNHDGQTCRCRNQNNFVELILKRAAR